MRRTTPYLLIILLVFSGFKVLPQSGPAEGSDRHALVIGNSDYDAGPLLNPGNDARAMANALRETGFEVMEHLDLSTRAEMKRVIREFGSRIRATGVGLFYYAGHGIQVDGKNYLIPTRAQIYAEEEVEYESVDLGFVLSQMEIAGNRMNILILDACRNNPFARSWRSASVGLAFINAPTGTLIAYATAPGSVASDGTGSNGLYTGELLKQLREPGLRIEDVFKNVRAEVLDKSNGMQTPWESSSLVGDFYFLPPDARLIAMPDRVEWKKETAEEYIFYRDGSNMTPNTRAVFTGNDILLFDETTGRNYLLEGFRDSQPGTIQKPSPLHGSSNAFWKRDEGNRLWFFLEGEEITRRIRNAYYGPNLVVFDKKTGRYFALYDYATAEPHRLYPAVYVFSPNNTLWWADDKYFFLYVDGEQVAGHTRFRIRDKDVVVHHEEASSSFLLRNYDEKKDQALRPTQVLYRPGLLTCSRDADNKHRIFREEMPYVLDGNAVYSENDLLVYDNSICQHIVFEDFLLAGPDNRIPGRAVYSGCDAIWRRKGDTFYLYYKGRLQTEDLVDSRMGKNGKDLEVTRHSSSTGFILKDYAGRDDNTLRPAYLATD